MAGRRRQDPQPWVKYGQGTVWDMLQAPRTSREVQRLLSTGCAVLDAALGGGVLTGGITDVCGESGSGKSQLCMQLALQSVLPDSIGGLRTPDNRGTCLYICTEGRFPSKRFVQMATHCEHRYRAALAVAAASATGGGGSGDGGGRAGGARRAGSRLMDRVLVSELLEPEEFWRFVQEKLPILVKIRDVRLVVVDSITGICRGELAGDREGMLQRSRWLHDFTSLVRCLAGTYSLAVVTVNQVSAMFEDGSDAIGGLGGQYSELYPFPPRVEHVRVLG
jgi:RecA/RadA recombinase